MWNTSLPPPAGQGAAGRVDEHPVAAGRLQRIDLQVGVLLAGRDACVAEEVGHAHECRITLQAAWFCDVDFGHGLWTLEERAERDLPGLLQKRAFMDATDRKGYDEDLTPAGSRPSSRRTGLSDLQ
jgi:hypothetical protein